MQEPRLAVFERKEFPWRDAVSVEALPKLDGGIQVVLIGEGESTPVDCQCGPASHVLVDQHRLFRIHMLIFHKPPGLVGTNWDGCDIKRPIHLTNLLEHVAVASITCKEEPVLGTDDAPASPEDLVVIVDRPLAPMLGRRKDKGDVGVGGGDVSAVPPVQLHHVLTAHLAHPRGKALGHEPAQAVIEPDVGTQRRTSRALLHVETRGVNICHHQFAFSISGTQRRSLRRLCVEIVFVDLSDNAVEKDISSCGISRLQLNSRKLKGPIKA